MNFFRSMDLYKAIVLLSLLLLPAGGWWCLQLEESIQSCRKAIDDANRQGGLLEQIGALQKKVEVVAQNRLTTSDATKMPERYFEGQILAAASGNLKTDDFSLSAPKMEPAATGSSKQKAADYVLDVTWKRKELYVKLDFVYAVLFNCESGARTGGDQQGLSSIWKLRELEIINATDDNKIFGSFKTPPPELEDKWTIRRMSFARREPRKDERGG